MGKPLFNFTLPSGQKCECPIHRGATIRKGLWYKNKNFGWFCPTCIKRLVEKKIRNWKQEYAKKPV